MATLIFKNGKHQGKKFTVPSSKELVIGRDPDCQIRLATNEISRRHCALRTTAEGLTVRDLGSRNGTMVNDALIQGETNVKPGDQLQVGPLLLEVAGKKQQAASDDNILDWLSENGATEGGISSGDTTVIKIRPEVQDEAEPAAVEEKPKAPMVAPKRRFKTVGEEGAEIIRRHLESVEKN